MKVPRRLKQRDLTRKPLFWGVVVFAAAFVIFLLWGLSVMPDISVLGGLAAGADEVPVRNLLGKELFVYHSPQYGEKIPLSLSEISDEMVALTITTEDSRFFSNPGFSPIAISRAVLQNLRLRKTYSGASTITQQLVRNIFIPEEKRFERSFLRKGMEICVAAAVTMCYDKETILTLYLNEIYYGRNATGVEKAAEIYFGKHASELGLYEAAYLAGLPQAPNYYANDPAAGARRQREVLRLMYRGAREDSCIQIRQGSDPLLYCPPPPGQPPGN